jgi:succinoglycan biosynthesis transport protein ExoP
LGNTGVKMAMNRLADGNPLERLGEYWRAVLRCKGVIVFATVMMTLAATVVIAVIPDVYRASTVILVDPQQVPEKYVTSTVTSDPNERLTTITQEVLSATRLQNIIDRMGLYPTLRSTMSREELIDYMRREVHIEVKQGSAQGLSAFTITYEGHNPEIVAKVTNELAASFINWNVAAREKQAEGTTDFLSSQLDAAKANLEEQESKLRDFKTRYLGEMPDQLQANMQNLSRIQVSLQANMDALARLDQERMLLQRTPDPEVKAPPPDSVSDERTRLQYEKRQLQNQLADLRKRYTEDYPDVAPLAARLARVDEQLKALPAPTGSVAKELSPSAVRLEIIAKEMKRLTDEQRALNRQASEYQAKIDAVPLREQQVAELSRNYENSKLHYNSLLDKQFSAEMAADLERKQKAERFTILDKARAPEKPFKPKRPMLMAAALFLSMCVSIGFVVVRETLDTSVRTQEDLRSLLPSSVPVLATIPYIKTQRQRHRRRRLALLMSAASVVTALVVAVLLWRIHPIL